VVFDAGSSSGGNVGMGGVQGSGGTHETGGTTGTGGFDSYDAGVEAPLRPDAATAQIDGQDADPACGTSGDAPCAGTLACPQTLAQECAAVDPPPATSGRRRCSEITNFLAKLRRCTRRRFSQRENRHLALGVFTLAPSAPAARRAENSCSSRRNNSPTTRSEKG